MAKATAVLAPNLGLFTTCDPLEVPDGALQAGMNFRITNGKLNNLNIGWSPLVNITFNGPVILCDRMYVAGTERAIIGTPTDLYFLDPVTPAYHYLTPVYHTGTVAVSTNAVTGSGTAFNTLNAQGRKNVAVGDQISFAANVTDPAATWYPVTAVGSDTSLTISGHTGTIGAGTSYTVRQLLTMTAANRWSTDIFTSAGSVGNDLWLATNGLDPVVNWNGTTASAVWGTPTFRAKKLKIYYNMCIYAAITEAGAFKAASIINSGLGDPNDFTGDSLFGEFVVGQGVEEVIRLEPLGDTLIAYRNGASQHGKATMIQFIGEPTVFSFREALTGIGPLGQGLVANFGNYHELVSRDGQYRFDGVNAVLCGQQLWRSVLSSIDPARNNVAFTHFHQTGGEVLWGVPLTTDPGVGQATGPLVSAYVESYLEVVPQGRDKPWAVRAFPFLSAGYITRSSTLTWNQIASAWKDSNFRWNDQFFFADFPLTICGDANGLVWVLDGAQSAQGTTLLPSQVVFGRRSLGDGRMRALLRRVYAFISQFTGTLQVQTQLAESASGPISVVDTQNMDMTLPQGGHFVSVFRRGRFYQLAFGTTGGPWSLSGYDTDQSPGGKR